MKILSNREYNKLINNIKDYEKKLDDISRENISLLEQITKLNTENYKLNNKIKSYKNKDNKNTIEIITKLYNVINNKLDYFDVFNTSADELDKLCEIYFGLKGTLEDE